MYSAYKKSFFGAPQISLEQLGHVEKSAPNIILWTVPVWWATHVVHHSGEHYNLSLSFRLSWVQHLKIIFFVPVALVGFHPVVFYDQLEAVRPIYDITSNFGSKANPFHINFHEFVDIVNDVKAARGLRQKLFFIFGSPIKIAEQKQRQAELNRLDTTATHAETVEPIQMALLK